MIKFGIIGAGSIAHSFCGGAGIVDKAEVMAVASKSLSRAKDFAESEGIANYYGDYESMLNNSDIDVVYIATTNNYHYENIKMCLEHGKNVICEKPLVETEEKAKELIAMAKDKKLFLMEAMWSRFLPKTKKVREWILQGKIGKVQLMQATIGFNAPKDSESRLYNAQLGGGALYDIGVYPIDLLPYFVNQKIKNIKSRIYRAESGVDKTVELSMELDDCLASAQATFEAVVPEDAYIYGTEGMIKIPKIHWGTDAILYNANQQEIEHFSQPQQYGFSYEIEEVVKCIENGQLESDVASHEMTLESSRIYDMLLGGDR